MMKFFTIFILLMEFSMGSILGNLKIRSQSVPFIFEESRQLPIISLQLVFQASGTISDTNISGVAHLSASLLNEGSLDLGSEKFAEILEESAIGLSAGVGTETFVIRIDSLKENFATGQKLLKNLLQNPNLQQKVLDRLKNKAQGKLLQKKSNFDYVASLELQKMIFPNTALSKPKSGTIEDIEQIQLSDIQNFFQNNLILQNVIPVIGGDLTKKEAKKIIADIFSVLPDGNKSKLQSYKFSTIDKNCILKRETKQAYIYFASPLNMKYSDSDLYKLKVASFILGSSGFGSRLMEEVRVKNGLAYSIYANANIEKSREFFSGHLQTKTENLDKAKSLVISVIKNFVENGVSQDELDSAKSFILGSEPLRNETLSQRIGSTFQNYYRGFDLNHRKQELELIQNLSLADLNQFISNHTEILNLSFSILTEK